MANIGSPTQWCMYCEEEFPVYEFQTAFCSLECEGKYLWPYDGDDDDYDDELLPHEKEGVPPPIDWDEVDWPTDSVSH